MDIYDVVVIVTFCGTGAYVMGKFLTLRTKQAQSNSLTMAKQGQRSKTLSDMVNDVPMALQQAQALYDEQLQIAQQQALEAVQARRMTEEQAKQRIMEVMKPLKDRIDWLQRAQKWEPVVRVGARIGDNVIKGIEKASQEMF